MLPNLVLACCLLTPYLTGCRRVIERRQIAMKALWYFKVIKRYTPYIPFHFIGTILFH